MLIQEITSAIRSAIESAISQGLWQRYEGPRSKELESELAKFLSHTHAQLTSSGTSALEILLRGAGIGSGDEVLLSSYDYPGNFWAIERVGARPVLVDTIVDSWRIDSDSLENAFLPTCKALVVSHLHGELQNTSELRRWSDGKGILLIEDICQAIGAEWEGTRVGRFGHAAIVSFGGGKILSCGRGGAWSTSDEKLAIKARIASGAGSGPYSISELQAATVLAQWPWLEAINSRCRTYFEALDQQLRIGGYDWVFVPKSRLESTALYQCGWLLNGSTTDEERQALLAALRSIPQEQKSEPAWLPFGSGFPGFHRRSERRCRIPAPLNNATSVSNRTVVLHHSVAIQQEYSAEKLADWIRSQIANLKAARGSSR